MKILWYDSKGVGLECVGLRDQWGALLSWRISPALEPERLLQKESTWLIVNISRWTPVHVIWPIPECTHSKPTRLAGLWPFPVLLSLEAKVRLWSSLFLCAQGHSQHLPSTCQRPPAGSGDLTSNGIQPRSVHLTKRKGKKKKLETKN